MSGKGKNREEDTYDPSPAEILENAVDVVTNMVSAFFQITQETQPTQHPQTTPPITTIPTWGEIRFAVSRLPDDQLGMLASIADPTISDALADRLFQQLMETSGLAAEFGIQRTAGPSHSQHIPSASADESQNIAPLATLFTEEELKAITTSPFKNSNDFDAWVKDFAPRYKLAQEMLNDPMHDADDAFWDAFNEVMKEHSSVIAHENKHKEKKGTLEAATNALEKARREKSLIRQGLDRAWQEVGKDITKDVEDARKQMEDLKDEQKKLARELTILKRKVHDSQFTTLQTSDFSSRLYEINEEITERIAQLDEYLQQSELPETQHQYIQQERDFQERQLATLIPHIRYEELYDLIDMAPDSVVEQVVELLPELKSISEPDEIQRALRDQVNDQLIILGNRLASETLMPMERLELELLQEQLQMRAAGLNVMILTRQIDDIRSERGTKSPNGKISELTQQRLNKLKKDLQEQNEKFKTHQDQASDLAAKVNEQLPFKLRPIKAANSILRKAKAEVESLRRRMQDLERVEANRLPFNIQSIKDDLVEKNNLAFLKFEIATLNKKRYEPTEEGNLNIEAQLNEKEEKLGATKKEDVETQLTLKRRRLAQIESKPRREELNPQQVEAIFPEFVDEDNLDALDAEEITEGEFVQRTLNSIPRDMVDERLANLRMGDLTEARTIADGRQMLLDRMAVQESLRMAAKIIRSLTDKEFASQSDLDEELKDKWIDTSNLLRDLSIKISEEDELKSQSEEIAQNLISYVIASPEVSGVRTAVHGDNFVNAIFLGTEFGIDGESDPHFAQIENGQLVIYRVPIEMAEYLFQDTGDEIIGQLFTQPIHDRERLQHELEARVNAFIENDSSHLTRVRELRGINIFGNDQELARIERTLEEDIREDEELITELNNPDGIVEYPRLQEILNYVSSEENLPTNPNKGIPAQLRNRENSLRNSLHRDLGLELRRLMTECLRFRNYSRRACTEEQLTKDTEFKDLDNHIQASIDTLNEISTRLPEDNTSLPIEQLVNLRNEVLTQRPIVGQLGQSTETFVNERLPTFRQNIISQLISLREIALNYNNQLGSLSLVREQANQGITVINEIGQNIDRMLRHAQQSDSSLKALMRIERHSQVSEQNLAANRVNVDSLVQQQREIQRQRHINLQKTILSNFKIVIASVQEQQRRINNELSIAGESNSQTQDISTSSPTDIVKLQNELEAHLTTLNKADSEVPRDRLLPIDQLNKISLALDEQQQLIITDLMPRINAIAPQGSNAPITLDENNASHSQGAANSQTQSPQRPPLLIYPLLPIATQGAIMREMADLGLELPFYNEQTQEVTTRNIRDFNDCALQVLFRVDTRLQEAYQNRIDNPAGWRSALTELRDQLIESRTAPDGTIHHITYSGITTEHLSRLFAMRGIEQHPIQEFVHLPLPTFLEESRIQGRSFAFHTGPHIEDNPLVINGYELAGNHHFELEATPHGWMLSDSNPLEPTPRYVPITTQQLLRGIQGRNFDLIQVPNAPLHHRLLPPETLVPNQSIDDLLAGRSSANAAERSNAILNNIGHEHQSDFETAFRDAFSISEQETNISYGRFIAPKVGTKINQAPYFVDRSGNAYYRISGQQNDNPISYVVSQRQRHGLGVARVGVAESFTVSTNPAKRKRLNETEQVHPMAKRRK